MPGCTKCNKTGFVSHLENQSPLGSGMVWNEEITELCECTENDQCPSCGMFWKGNNKEFNQYWDGDGEEFSCIYCLWKSTDPPSYTRFLEEYYTLTSEEAFKAPARRQMDQLLHMTFTGIN